jgi:CDP-4-dehydro-6-deoxyglucose reductase, E1
MIDYLHQGAQAFMGSEKPSADMQVAGGVARLEKLDGFAARRHESFAYVRAALEPPADSDSPPLCGLRPEWRTTP